MENETTSGYLTLEYLENLTEPFNDPATFEQLTETDIWKEVVGNLWVNRDKSDPDFGSSAVEEWDLDGIPTSIVGIQIDENRDFALAYYAGIPDYEITEPGILNEPENVYGILKLPLSPIEDTDAIHELTGSLYVGIFNSGSGIFNYTDTFTYENEGTWSYDAFVAEAAAINDDGAHATPTGEFHNHIQSADTLEELNDPFALGNLEHSLAIGYGLDGNPVYGPLGYTTTDGSGDLEVLRSSYVARTWGEDTTGHRSSLPGWAVNNWDDSAATGTSIVNLTGRDKAEVLLSDGVNDGTVTYTGEDAELAAEIAWYSDASNGHTLFEDEQGYAYWEHEVDLPDGSGTATVQNYLLNSSDLWGPEYNETILPAMYPEGEAEEFQFSAVVGAFAEDYEFVEGYGDLDFYNGIDSYIPELGKSEYHYVTSFSSDLADEDRLEGVAFPYVLGVQYKSEIDVFNSDAATKIDFLADPNNQLETVYDLGITDKDDNGNLIAGSIIETWQAEQTVTTEGPGGGGAPPGGAPPGGAPPGGGMPPVEETPTEETPVEEIPTEETPVEETPIEETPTEETTSIEEIITQNVDGNEVELIDLRSSTAPVTASYSISRDASFNNEVYFYQVDDITGSVDGVAVGSENYLATAIDNILSPAFSTSNGNTETGTVDFEAGLMAALMIQDGGLAEALDGSAAVYTSYLGANSNRADHIKVLNGSTFGFEDLPNGGDQDFNDIVIQFSDFL